MANKNKGKVIPMLSPENYIKTKARSLPIYECIVNADWEESKTAMVTAVLNADRSYGRCQVSRPVSVRSS